MARLQSSFFKYWVLTSIPDEEGGVSEARPLGFPPELPPQRGWQGFDFREDGKIGRLNRGLVIASEAKQSSLLIQESWIASSLRSSQ